MPRANRLFCADRIWHITHRCHKKMYLLKFARDRRRWRHWLFEAKKRYGLCVLDYIATSNHIHLLVHDTGRNAIPRSMQLVAARTAQEYNNRKNRRGAFWEDRYHATAIQSGDHLARCITYIDLNMVRAGAVCHPLEWQVSGYREVQVPPLRRRVVDGERLCRLLGVASRDQLQELQKQWVEEALETRRLAHQPHWSGSVAVGDRDYLEKLLSDLGAPAMHRRIESDTDTTYIRELPDRYAHNLAPKIGRLSSDTA